MRVAIGLGSNQGDRLGQLRGAISGLSLSAEITAVSSLYRSDPVGGPEQPDFLNAVVVVDADLTLRALLAVCQQLENAAGRSREERWGPRSLDVDLLTAAAAPVDDPDLMVPHPRLPDRRFALEPLAEVWPDAATGATTARVGLEAVADQSVDRLADPGWETALSRGGWWVGVQVVAMAAVLVAAFTTDHGLWFDGRWLGAVIVLIGALLIVAAFRSLGRNLTAFPEPLEGSSMVSSGVYGLARHPIYGANVLLLSGVAIRQGSLLALGGAIAVGGFFWFKSTFEERRLLIAHSQYRQYQAAVRRRLLPFIV